uniref:Uncharacterized protein n=1 Tax=Oryza sativa subsp. japonica TaxID=39947 RepID=Q6ZBX3_ORYSJ|nr:hypothetical protein [Oryza sativa Japonica Group]
MLLMWPLVIICMSCLLKWSQILVLGILFLWIWIILGMGDGKRNDDGENDKDMGKKSGPGVSDVSMATDSNLTERGGPSFTSSQLSLIPESEGLTASDEDFDGLDEETVLVEQEKLVGKISAIPEALISSSRKSKRRASDSDQLVLERAERLKAEKNLEKPHA